MQRRPVITRQRILGAPVRCRLTDPVGVGCLSECVKRFPEGQHFCGTTVRDVKVDNTKTNPCSTESKARHDAPTRRPRSHASRQYRQHGGYAGSSRYRQRGTPPPRGSGWAQAGDIVEHLYTTRKWLRLTWGSPGNPTHLVTPAETAYERQYPHPAARQMASVS